MTNLNRTMRRRLTALTVLAAALAGGVTACSTPTGRDDAKPAAAPTSTAPAPLPSQDWNRQACTTLPHGMLELLDNLADTRKAGEYAAKSSDGLMRRHGDSLLDAVTARETADMGGDHNAAVDANLDISQAALDMAEACSQLYGDGNW